MRWRTPALACVVLAAMVPSAAAPGAGTTAGPLERKARRPPPGDHTGSSYSRDAAAPGAGGCSCPATSTRASKFGSVKDFVMFTPAPITVNDSCAMTVVPAVILIDCGVDGRVDQVGLVPLDQKAPARRLTVAHALDGRGKSAAANQGFPWTSPGRSAANSAARERIPSLR